MTEKSVRLSVEARMKGGEQTAREARKLQEAVKPPKDAVPSYQALEKTVTRVAHGMARLGSLVKDLNKVLAVKDGARELAETRKETERLGQAFDKLNQARRKERQEQRSL